MHLARPAVQIAAPWISVVGGLLIIAPPALAALRSVKVSNVPLTQPIHAPELNKEVEAEVGQSLVTEAELRQSPELTVKVAFTVPRPGGSLTVTPGTYRSIGTDDTGRFFDRDNAVLVKNWPSNNTWRGGVYVPNDHEQAPEIYFVGFGGILQTRPAPGLLAEQTMHQEVGERSFRRELIYAGTLSGAVKLTYREFKDDFARPAFNQELSYDLKDGDEIGFKGARIKIIKANNVSIRYIVTKTLD